MHCIYKPVSEFLLDDQPFILIHGVNQLMAMGSGIALAIREQWPVVFEQYQEIGRLPLGDSQWIEVGPRQFVINLFTQQFVRGYNGNFTDPAADPNAICAGLLRIITDQRAEGIPIYLPRIGCDLGGLDWQNVSVDIARIEALWGDNFFIIDNKK